MAEPGENLRPISFIVGIKKISSINLSEVFVGRGGEGGPYKILYSRTALPSFLLFPTREREIPVGLYRKEI